LTSRTTSTAAFVLSLVGGILILLGSVVTWMWLVLDGFNFDGMMNGFGHMMGGYQDMMDGFGFTHGFMMGLPFVGVVSGIVVIISAVMLAAQPAARLTWGTIILAFSVISFLGMGGFWIGAILGIAGGALAISTRPAQKSRA